jgi:hypothetical protein
MVFGLPFPYFCLFFFFPSSPIEACFNTLLLVLCFLHTLLVEIIVLHNSRHIDIVVPLFNVVNVVDCECPVMFDDHLPLM